MYEHITSVITAHYVFTLKTNPANAAWDNNRCLLRDSFDTLKRTSPAEKLHL